VIRAVRRLLLRIVLLAAAALPAGAAEILPFADLEVGMTGTGRTVWSGAQVEEFKIEIVALLPNVLPQRNLILVRCSGGPLATAGVSQGMSGSPIYVRGRLIGALAYSWGFSKEPIAGVTPIAEMLAIPGPSVQPTARATLAPSLEPAFSAATLGPFFADLLRRSTSTAAPGLARPLGLPLHAVGFEPEVLTQLGSLFGATAQAGGSPAPTAGPPPPALIPGSAVGVQLARGDLDLTAIGTVTSVEGGRVLAFGHPFINIGSTAMPMTAAQVHLVFPAVDSSFKIASPLAEVGAIRQDRSSGILGVVGDHPALVPVRLELRSQESEPRTFRYDLVDDPLLTPVLLNYTVLSILSSAEKDLGPLTLRLREGSSIQIKDHAAVELDNFFGADSAAPFAAGLSAYLLYVVMNNEHLNPEIEGINLLLEAVPERRSARIEEVWADRERVRAGETVHLSVMLRPYRGAPQQKVIDLPIPRETAPGRLMVRVGDGLTFARLETKGEPVNLQPRTFDQLIWLINQIRAFNRVYANVSILDEGVVVGGLPLPNLPPSIAQVMLMPQAGGSFARLRQRGLLEESVETDLAVTGYRKIALEVVP